MKVMIERVPMKMVDFPDDSASMIVKAVSNEDDVRTGELVDYTIQIFVYCHGFPDLSIHPVTCDYVSRFPQKFHQHLFSPTYESIHGSMFIFVCFNFLGLPGTTGLRFQDKTIAQEIHDTQQVITWIINQVNARHGPHRPIQLNLMGLSTGANIVSLLRGNISIRHLHVSCTFCAIAGLADLAQGIDLDFTIEQIQDMETKGMCWKEFYLPHDLPLPSEATPGLDTTNTGQSRKIYMPLNRKYRDQCLDGVTLDIHQSITAASAKARPFLVIHGNADQHVPIEYGRALFECAVHPKVWYEAKKGNHFYSNSKVMKKVLRVIQDFHQQVYHPVSSTYVSSSS